MSEQIKQNFLFDSTHDGGENQSQSDRISKNIFIINCEISILKNLQL